MRRTRTPCWTFTRARTNPGGSPRTRPRGTGMPRAPGARHMPTCMRRTPHAIGTARAPGSGTARHGASCGQSSAGGSIPTGGSNGRRRRRCSHRRHVRGASMVACLAVAAAPGVASIGWMRVALPGGCHLGFRLRRSAGQNERPLSRQTAVGWRGASLHPCAVWVVCARRPAERHLASASSGAWRTACAAAFQRPTPRCMCEAPAAPGTAMGSSVQHPSPPTKDKRIEGRRLRSREPGRGVQTGG